MSISDIQECYKAGFEITSHGDQHLLAADDLKTSLEKLEKWQVIQKDVLGFSFPNSQLDENDVKILKEANIQYARSGRSKACYSLINKILYILQNNFKLIKPFTHLTVIIVLWHFHKTFIIYLQQLLKVQTQLLKLFIY